MWLVIVDTMQIQPYIFGSNHLRENVGASYLVDAATRDWAFDAVKKAAPAHNIGGGKSLVESKKIEMGLDAEVIYAGGGNFVALFSTPEHVKEFQSILSLRALQEAPGLQLVIVQEELIWGKDVLSKKLHSAFHAVEVRKRNRVWPAPLLGLGVTAACRSTGLPATGMAPGIGGEPGYLASAEILAKLDVARAQQSSKSLADQRLQETAPLNNYCYPADVEDMGVTVNEYNHIAVVHADGNGMGQRIREIGDVHATPDTNRPCIQALRDFSLRVQQAAEKALQTVLDQLIQSFDSTDGTSIVHRPNDDDVIQIQLKTKAGCTYVPFRPIVFGGDDITFVCDGRLGIALALAYLRAFEYYTIGLGSDGKKGLTACAGIAIVKSHYPFARAYMLAVDVTRSAKAYRRDRHIEGSCLDWHFALSGLGNSIQEIRNREYKVEERNLTLRPVTLGDNREDAMHAWPVIWRGIQAFQEENWAGRRNKIKALRDALRQGPSSVEHFLTAYNHQNELPSVLPGRDNWIRKTGWQGDTCGYFDAIELVDWFIPLKGAVDATLTTPSPS